MAQEITPISDDLAAHNDGTFEQCYIVGNIPSQFRSADLRAYFSQFTEKKGFICFHYRHRPQIAMGTTDGSKDKNESNDCCCIVKVDPNMIDEFLHLYNNQPWELANGELIEGSVKINLAEESSIKSKLSKCFCCKLQL